MVNDESFNHLKSEHEVSKPLDLQGKENQSIKIDAPNLGRSPKEGLNVRTNVFAPARCEATPKLMSITYSNAYSAL